MGRHHIDDDAVLRRMELLEDYVASLSDELDAANTKIDEVAAEMDKRVADAEAVAAGKVAALRERLHSLLGSTDAAPAAPAEPVVEPVVEPVDPTPSTWPGTQ